MCFNKQVFFEISVIIDKFFITISFINLIFFNFNVACGGKLYIYFLNIIKLMNNFCVKCRVANAVFKLSQIVNILNL